MAAIIQTCGICARPAKTTLEWHFVVIKFFFFKVALNKNTFQSNVYFESKHVFGKQVFGFLLSWPLSSARGLKLFDVGDVVSLWLWKFWN